MLPSIVKKAKKGFFPKGQKKKVLICDTVLTKVKELAIFYFVAKVSNTISLFRHIFVCFSYAAPK